MAIAILGTRGLFSTLQEAFRNTADNHRIKLSRPVHDFLRDFPWLALDLARRPTRIGEVIPVTPCTHGACDAAGSGMGGVHFIPSRNKILPILWRQQFPTNMTKALVSFANPRGTITNSDLELEGSIAQADMWCQAVDVQERTIHNCYDDIATVHWQQKGSTTTLGLVAYLLRLQAIH